MITARYTHLENRSNLQLVHDGHHDVDSDGEQEDCRQNAPSHVESVRVEMTSEAHDARRGHNGREHGQGEGQHFYSSTSEKHFIGRQASALLEGEEEAQSQVCTHNDSEHRILNRVQHAEREECSFRAFKWVQNDVPAFTVMKQLRRQIARCA